MSDGDEDHVVDSGVHSLSDDALVAAIGRGNHDALAEVYNRYGARVHRLAAQLCGTDRADDVTQEVFLRLWRHPESYDADRGSLRAVLLMQAHGRAIDLLRSNGARGTREAPDILRACEAGVAVEATVLAQLIGDTAARLLSVLSASQRNAIVLAYFGGHTYREVARLLDQPEGAVKSRIRSGLLRLRDHSDPTPTHTHTVSGSEKTESE